MNNIIFVPVGNPIAFHDEYDKDNHWRYTKDTRNYQTIVYSYNDYHIPEDTYDILVKDKGFKWDMARHFMETYDFRDYDYIGFWDDDLVTDIQSINRGLEIAQKNDIKVWQLSTVAGSASSHRILHQDKQNSYTLTNFNEGMGPFFHSSLIPKLLKFFDFHEVKSGWGFDWVFSGITKEKCGVIHECSMYHPDKPPSYDRGEASREMSNIINTVYPKYMKDVYNEDTGPFNTEYKTYEVTLKG